MLLGNLIGLVISVAARWPAEFGGVGDPDNVAREFFSRGTLLAAPLAPLVALVVSAFLALRAGGWLRVLGLVGLMVIGVLFIIGTLGEPQRPEASDPPVVFLLAWQAVFIAISAMQIVLAGAELFQRVRPRGAALGPSSDEG